MLSTPSVPALLPTYAPYPFLLVRGEGDRVFDEQGQAWWDFYGGHCVCATGHATRLIPEGAWVTVDADSGRVTWA